MLSNDRRGADRRDRGLAPPARPIMPRSADGAAPAEAAPGALPPATGAWAAGPQAAVERTVTGLGYELVDVERAGGGLLRVTIDRIPGHAYDLALGEGEFVTVDDCERVTRQLQYVLEVEGVDYARLEVSSPGLDRPLRTAAHFERFEGQAVSVTLRSAIGGRRRFEGPLHAREGGWRVVFTDAGVEHALDFTLDEIREARLVPVLDFKGRRRAQAAPATEPVDGGLKE